jgi:3',5'-cyclic AMP phosphodiesterase CpdA
MLPGYSPAASARRPANWWAMVADPHIDLSAEVSERGGNMGERFKRVIRDILEGDGLPSGVIVAGDLAHREGQREAYTRLLGLAYPLRQAGIDVYWLLGNHDNREHFLDAAYAGRNPELPVRDRYARIVQRDGVRWFLLDSLIRPNHAPGELGREQMDWLRRELDADPRRPAVLVLHHNVDEQGGHLVDGKEFFELARSKPQVKAVFQGHNHVYVTREARGVHFVKVPAVGYVFSVEDPIGYLRVQVAPGGCRLELRALEGNTQRHGEECRLQWRE